MLAKKYPYAVSLDDYSIRAIGTKLSLSVISRDETVARLALERLRAALVNGEVPVGLADNADDEVFSFYVAAALAAALGPRAVKSLAAGEAKRAHSSFKMEDESELVKLAKALGVAVKVDGTSIPWIVDGKGRVVRRVLRYHVPVRDYLIIHRGVEGALTNAPLKGGRVYLDRQGLEDLLAKAVEHRVVEIAANLEDHAHELPEHLMARARLVLDESQLRGLLPWSPEALPPCVLNILDKIRSESKPSDREVYLLVTTLGRIAVRPEDLSRKFGLEERLALGLLALARHAAARGFSVYTCDAAKSLGICPLEERCASSPVSAYARALKARRRGAAGERGQGVNEPR